MKIGVGDITFEALSDSNKKSLELVIYQQVSIFCVAEMKDFDYILKGKNQITPYQDYANIDSCRLKTMNVMQNCFIE